MLLFGQILILRSNCEVLIIVWFFVKVWYFDRTLLFWSNFDFWGRPFWRLDQRNPPGFHPEAPTNCAVVPMCCAFVGLWVLSWMHMLRVRPSLASLLLIVWTLAAYVLLSVCPAMYYVLQSFLRLAELWRNSCIVLPTLWPWPRVAHLLCRDRRILAEPTWSLTAAWDLLNSGQSHDSFRGVVA